MKKTTNKKDTGSIKKVSRLKLQRANKREIKIKKKEMIKLKQNLIRII